MKIVLNTVSKMNFFPISAQIILLLFPISFFFLERWWLHIFIEVTILIYTEGLCYIHSLQKDDMDKIRPIFIGTIVIWL